MTSKLVLVAGVGNIGADSDDVFVAKIAPILRELPTQREWWGWQRERGTITPAEGFDAKTLFRGGGFQNLRLIGWYAGWMTAVFAKAVRAPDDLYFCAGFDTGFPMAVASLLRGRRFIWANMDNISLSHRWPTPVRAAFTALEKFVAKRALLHVVPGPSRWPTRDANLAYLPNTPSSKSLNQAREIARAKGYARGDRFTLYVNGWLPATRGVATLVRALKRIPPGELDVVVAGEAVVPEARELVALPGVRYLGRISTEESLALYWSAHATLTYYDPAIAINRVAEPNKWGDCIATNTPFIVNSEVRTAEPFVRAGACFALPYHDDAALAALLRELARDRARIEQVRQNLHKFDAPAWDTAFAGLMQGVLEKQAVARPGDADSKLTQEHRS